MSNALDIMEMFDIPITKDVVDLLKQMEQWYEPYTPLYPDYPTIHPRWTITTDRNSEEL